MVTDEMVERAYTAILGRVNNKQTMRIALQAALSAQDTGAIAGVRVKDLQWHKSHMPSWNGDWHTTTPFIYTVRCADENGWKWSAHGASGYAHSPEAAKAAAQADYSARIISALEPQERDGWKPIDTAPKDGTWILVSNPKYDHPFVVRWLRDGWGEDDPGPWGTDIGYWGPTHWMPSPAAPPHTEGK